MTQRSIEVKSHKETKAFFFPLFPEARWGFYRLNVFFVFLYFKYFLNATLSDKLGYYLLHSSAYEFNAKMNSTIYLFGIYSKTHKKKDFLVIASPETAAFHDKIVLFVAKKICLIFQTPYALTRRQRNIHTIETQQMYIKCIWVIFQRFYAWK